MVNFKEQGLRFAFGIEGALDKALKNDHRYVKWVVRALYKVSESQRAETLLPFHRCTEADFDAFYPPSVDSAPLFNAYKKNVGTHRGLYCFDWEATGDLLSIWGGSSNDELYQRIEFVLLPCNYLHAQYGDVGDRIHPECIADRKQQEEYLGNLKIVILMDE